MFVDAVVIAAAGIDIGWLSLMHHNPLPMLQYPLIGLKIFQGANHTLANAELRPPAERPHLGGVEKDKRAVADPAALAARVAPLGRHAQVRADPAERFVHSAVLLGAQVEDIDRIIGTRDH